MFALSCIPLLNVAHTTNCEIPFSSQHCSLCFITTFFPTPTKMAPRKRSRGALAKKKASKTSVRTPARSTRSRSAAQALAEADAGSASDRLSSPAQSTPTSNALPAGSVSVVSTPCRKRRASRTVSVLAVFGAFLMRSQLSATPVAKRTAALPPSLARSLCLRCSKRLDEASVITRKGKAINVGSACVKLPNKKCAYCAAQHHECEEVR